MHTYFTIVNCSLTIPNNGNINCSLGDDGVPSYEDTCSFICNTGYELTGSDTRTCQSDRSWSGSNATCKRGMYLKLPVIEVCKLWLHFTCTYIVIHSYLQ